jgi:predicted MFS family arabinose efflux permease
MTQKSNKEKLFSSYQILMIAILSLIQFTVILDFMVLSPLGALLMQELQINTSQFGLVVSAYAFSAGASGLMAAGFADKFDRKKLLLFFYTGFIMGTVFCAIAPNYFFLLMARIITGIFGGVITSISFAIISDLFQMHVRGRVMGFVQMAFAISQVLGIPVGLILANNYGWHSPFWMIAIFGMLLGVVIVIYMQPITEHLKVKSTRNPFQHLAKTISNPAYLRAFMAMPFSSAFCTNNIGITMGQLPILYGITGVFSMAFGPLIGKLSDRIGKYKMFVIGSVISMIMVIVYTNLGVTALWVVITINVFLFAGISSRMIAASALMTAIPELQDRGAFMSVNSSVQQISGGIASAVAGLIVLQTSTGKLQHYNTLGYVVMGSMIIAVAMMYSIDKYVKINGKDQKQPVPVEDELLPT